MSNWEEYKTFATGKRLGDFGEYDLYLNDEKEIVRIFHEDVYASKQETRPKVFHILENELDDIVTLINNYTNPTGYIDNQGVVWSAEAVAEDAKFKLNEQFG